MKLHAATAKKAATRHIELTETVDGVVAIWAPSKGTEWEVTQTRGNPKDAIEAVANDQDEIYATMTEDGNELDFGEFLKTGQAEDEQPEEAEESDKAGGVVPIRYRNEYKARGDARGNCDGLFKVLKEQVLVGDKLDVAALEGIAAANGLDISKYNRTSHGWQGRLRMTTGNMLRKVVKANSNMLKLANGDRIEVSLGKGE